VITQEDNLTEGPLWVACGKSEVLVAGLEGWAEGWSEATSIV